MIVVITFLEKLMVLQMDSGEIIMILVRVQVNPYQSALPKPPPGKPEHPQRK
jgi:hypothetical protein